MKAVRVHRFGGPEVMAYEDIARPIPASDEVLVRIEAVGVGPWDAWIRAGRSALPQPLPLTLGSDLAGVVEDVGHEVTDFHSGTEVYGVTNSQFTGAYAQFAVAKAAMLAGKPKSLSFVEAASLLALAAMTRDALTIEIVDISVLPLYNQDIDTTPPAAWTAFRSRVKRAEAVLFATPEYNRSVPGALKNAIDVGSRPYGSSAWGG
jgi:NADPH:quinone reductase-like Zn-dependent oxidoreductase